MTKTRPVILLKKWGENGYHLSKSVKQNVDGRERYENLQYYGEIYLLTNKNNHYAIVYDREIPALSGPPGQDTLLLLSGTEEQFNILKKDSLEELTLNAALTEARRLAKKEGLVVRRKN